MRNLTFATKDEWARHNQAFLAALPEARERFQSRAERRHLAADGTIDSLGAIGDWYLEELSNPDSSDAPLPPWWASSQPWSGAGTPDDLPVTRDQVMLTDEVHSYFAGVLHDSYPGAKWVIFKGERREITRGMTLLELGDRKWPVNTVGVLYTNALRALDGNVQPANWLKFRALTEMAR